MITEKQLSDLRDVHAVQGTKGNYDYNEYMRGMYNGMELMLAIVENREPAYKDYITEASV
jgi:hypothetical protein